MKLNSTTLLRLSALILVAIGAYGIYAWQIKEEKVVIREVGPIIPTPWYYYAIPLLLLVFFGSKLLARHPFKSPVMKTLAMFVLLAGVAFCGIKTFDSLKADQLFKNNSSVQAAPTTYTPPRSATAQSVPQPYTPPPPPPQQQEPEKPQPLPQYSYEQCWQIVRRAADDESVAVPPECRTAQEEYYRQQRAAAEARQQQEQEAAAARERERQEAERIAEQQRREEQQRAYEAQQNRIRAEQAQRAAEERMRQEQQERARAIERAAQDILDKIRRRRP